MHSTSCCRGGTRILLSSELGASADAKHSPGSGSLQPHRHWAAVLPLQLL